ncbi:HPr kinase/phosphorylase [Sulfitobacter sp.]|jgi:HPr kinase/phosphorylase|uniref:HPr kinase/phosphorylase n=1 Tax=Sulfitobacter sp. TaxID=1903071 RepID=UPI003002C119
MDTQGLTLHATTVAFEGKGIMIFGQSGSGKSSLALELIGLGADLVADDRTLVESTAGRVVASSPSAITGLIEARGVGILPVQYVKSAAVVLTVDMSCVETERLPLQHSMTVLDIPLPCLHKVNAPYFPAAIRTYLRGLKVEM